jgi:hypothetical protein
MARSLFNISTLTRGSRNGFAGRYEPDFEPEEWPQRTRLTETSQRRGRIKLPWIFRYVGYHLMAALGIVIAFIVWLLVMAA